jgi:hypothetical protein
MASTDPRKLKALLNQSQQQAVEDDEPAVEAGGDDAEEEGLDEEDLDGEEGDEEEITVEQLADKLKPAVETLNQIVDDFRAGGDKQPKAGIESLEELEEVGAELVHQFCEWTDDVGKKDFRKLGEALELEDVDGFVGWCRAVHKMEQDGSGEGDVDETEDKGEGGDEGDDQDGNVDEQEDDGE